MSANDSAWSARPKCAREAPARVLWRPRGPRRTPSYAKSSPIRLDALRWKSTRASPSVRRARNLRSGDFVVSNLDDRQGTGIRTVSHVLLLVRLGIASEQDAGCTVGQ